MFSRNCTASFAEHCRVCESHTIETEGLRIANVAHAPMQLACDWHAFHYSEVKKKTHRDEVYG